jgi:hypothetical protein
MNPVEASLITQSCTTLGGGWSITHATSSYAEVSGIFAAVMLPFLGLILTASVPDPSQRWKSRAPILIFAAFVFLVTAAYLYSLVSGDYDCTRANVAAVPIGLLFATGAALSLVGICWLVQDNRVSRFACNIFILIAFAAFVVISISAAVTLIDMVVYSSRSSGWPPLHDSVLVLLPPGLIIGLGFYRYTHVSFTKRAALQLGSRLAWISELAAALILLTLYLACAIAASIIDDSSFTPRSGHWVAIAMIFGVLFSLAIAGLFILMPRPQKVEQNSLTANGDPYVTLLADQILKPICGDENGIQTTELRVWECQLNLAPL